VIGKFRSSKESASDGLRQANLILPGLQRFKMKILEFKIFVDVEMLFLKFLLLEYDVTFFHLPLMKVELHGQLPIQNHEEIQIFDT